MSHPYMGIGFLAISSSHTDHVAQDHREGEGEGKRARERERDASLAVRTRRDFKETSKVTASTFSLLVL